VKLTSTVNGSATSTVGTIETRAMNQHWSTNSPNWKGRRTEKRSTSIVMAKKLPNARRGVSISAGIAMAATPLPVLGRRCGGCSARNAAAL